MKSARPLMFLILSCFLVSSALADRVTLDTGNSLEGIVREEKDRVVLQYVSPGAEKYRMKTVVIPRERIRSIDRDPSYFEKYRDQIKGMNSVSAESAAVPASKADDSLAEAIRQGNVQVEENLKEQQQHMRDAKFYSGWHEGYHWDPTNGWHRWSHEGLYDPKDSKIQVRE